MSSISRTRRRSGCSVPLRVLFCRSLFLYIRISLFSIELGDCFIGSAELMAIVVCNVWQYGVSRFQRRRISTSQTSHAKLARLRATRRLIASLFQASTCTFVCPCPISGPCLSYCFAQSSLHSIAAGQLVPRYRSVTIERYTFANHPRHSTYYEAEKRTSRKA
jgi:hypothetical protein